MASIPSVFGEIDADAQPIIRNVIHDALTGDLADFGYPDVSLSEKQADEIWYLMVAGESMAHVDKVNLALRAV